MRCFAFTYYVILFYARCALVSHTHFILCWDIHVVYNHIFFCRVFFCFAIFVLTQVVVDESVYFFIHNFKWRTSLSRFSFAHYILHTNNPDQHKQKKQETSRVGVQNCAICSLLCVTTTTRMQEREEERKEWDGENRENLKLRLNERSQANEAQKLVCFLQEVIINAISTSIPHRSEREITTRKEKEKKIKLKTLSWTSSLLLLPVFLPIITVASVRSNSIVARLQQNKNIELTDDDDNDDLRSEAMTQQASKPWMKSIFSVRWHGREREKERCDGEATQEWNRIEPRRETWFFYSCSRFDDK